ncbi:MAG: acyl-CoA/acyl-ACP dehydrogenase [Proteobacteria bacterium]|nr:acyl-CoA/acyl-ACP dehydrogenase [Pseudomonadota bacterium]
MSKGSHRELKLLGNAAADFSRKELAPSREENDKYPYGAFFDTVINKAYTIDFFHIILPEDAGGMGQGMAALSVVLEHICQEDSSLGGIIFTCSAAHEIMKAAGSMDVLSQITDVAENVNDFLIAFPVFNNPSEIPHLACARKDGDRYILTGSIEYMVLGNIAAKALVPAKISDDNTFSFFLVDLKDKGISISDPILSLGLHACPATDISFQDVNGILIGEENKGKDYFNAMAEKFHVAAAAMSQGIMKGAFKEALAYTKGRFQGGRQIVNWSEMKMILANMAVKIKVSEMILASATVAVDENGNGWRECAKAAAIHIQELACDLTTDGIQVLGGVGYMKDFGQEKRFRDAKHIQAILGLAPLKKIDYLENFIM